MDGDVRIVEGLVIHPGDTLVINYGQDYTYEDMEVDGFKAMIEGVLPDGAKCLVMAGVEQLAVIRGDSDGSSSVDGQQGHIRHAGDSAHPSEASAPPVDH